MGRPAGRRPAPMAPRDPPPQFCFLWAPLNFDDAVVHYIVFEDGRRRAVVGGRGVLPVIGPRRPDVGPDVTFEHIAGVEHDVTWEPGLAPVATAPSCTFRRRRRRARATSSSSRS